MTTVRRLGVLCVALVLILVGCGRTLYPPNPSTVCYDGCDHVSVTDSKCITDAQEVQQGRVQPNDMTDLHGVLKLIRGSKWGTDRSQDCSNIYWAEFWPDHSNTLAYELEVDISGLKALPTDTVISQNPTQMSRTLGFFVGVNQRVNAHVCNLRDIVPRQCGAGLASTVGSG